MTVTAAIRHLYISPGHNYRGRHNSPAGNYRTLECASVQCLAGRGIAGDRYLDHQPDFKGQITFFAFEHFQQMWDDLGVPEDRRDPSASRRNVIVEGMDLNALIGKEFALQGVRFLGVEECKPCYWMNQAIHPQAESWMKGKGGLRAKIIESGCLAVTGAAHGEPLASALMAGGRSARMGHDKALINIEGQPLWKRQVALLRRMGGPVCVTAPHRPGWLPESVEWVADPPGELGPLGGLLAALEWAQERGAARLLVMAVDLPRMRDDGLRGLLTACQPGLGVIPQSGTDYEPLVAVYPVGALPVVRSAMEARRPKLQLLAAELVAAGLARPLAPPDPSCLENMNCPEEVPR